MSNSEITSELIDHVKKAQQMANKYQSQLSNDSIAEGSDIGLKTRHFYNNLGSLPGVRVLEFGNKNFGSSISFLENNSDCSLFVTDMVDRQISLKRLKIKYGISEDQLNIIPINSFEHKLQWDHIRYEIDAIAGDAPFDIILYDAARRIPSYSEFIREIKSFASTEFVLIIDDITNILTYVGTEIGLRENGVNVLYHAKYSQSVNDLEQKMKHFNQGLGVFVCSF